MNSHGWPYRVILSNWNLDDRRNLSPGTASLCSIRFRLDDFAVRGGSVGDLQRGGAFGAGLAEIVRHVVPHVAASERRRDFRTFSSGHRWCFGHPTLN